MKPSFLRSSLLLAAICVPALALAQSRTSPPPATDFADFRPTAGLREFTLGGSGASNRHFSDSLGGVSASYGAFLDEHWQWAVRQTLNYANPQGESRTWSGSTRIAFDYHLDPMGRFLPFVGINAGRIYGSSVRDTWAAGLEVGGKYYVQPRTFLFALVEYDWLFRRTRDLDNNFGSGTVHWSLGVGFNF